jgi:probable HAF family extracellular repeat protein
VALIALAIPLQLAAQDNNGSDKHDRHHTHHHYQVIDIGTFGGPSSYFNDLNLGDTFNSLCCAFYGFAQVLNQHGTLVGWGETTTPDPYPGFCYTLDCFAAHAFQWQEGVKTDLGVLPGASSAAFWINSNGLIVGNSENGKTDPLIPGFPEIRAVLWERGEITDLGTLGGNQSFAEAVNDRGQVTGAALNAIPDPFSFYDLFVGGFSPSGTQTRGFLWDNGVMEDLGTLGGPDAFPSLLNQRGQIAGYSYTNSIVNPTTGLPTFHPFLWEREKGMKDLGDFGGTATASVNGLNERGEVVGGTYLPGDIQIHPFLWNGAKLIDLTAPPFGGSVNGEANWINDAGEVVGLAGLPAPCPGTSNWWQQAFLWKNGVMMDLGAVAGTPNSTAAFINSKTQIVGFSWSCDGSVVNASLWENGSMADLNTLIPPSSPFHLYSASFIDDQGEIAAYGLLAKGNTHALLLIPCDENQNGEGCEEGGAENDGHQTSPPKRTAPDGDLLPSLLHPVSRLRFPGSAFTPRK